MIAQSIRVRGKSDESMAEVLMTGPFRATGRGWAGAAGGAAPIETPAARDEGPAVAAAGRAPGGPQGGAGGGHACGQPSRTRRRRGRWRGLRLPIRLLPQTADA